MTGHCRYQSKFVDSTSLSSLPFMTKALFFSFGLIKVDLEPYKLTKTNKNEPNSWVTCIYRYMFIYISAKPVPISVILAYVFAIRILRRRKKCKKSLTWQQDDKFKFLFPRTKLLPFKGTISLMQFPFIKHVRNYFQKINSKAFYYPIVCPIVIIFGLLICHCNLRTFQKVTDKAIEIA